MSTRLIRGRQEAAMEYMFLINVDETQGPPGTRPPTASRR